MTGSEIKKRIERYVKVTNMGQLVAGKYDMKLPELFELNEIAEMDSLAALCLAYNYGKAKGYRAAKAEVRK